MLIGVCTVTAYIDHLHGRYINRQNRSIISSSTGSNTSHMKSLHVANSHSVPKVVRKDISTKNRHHRMNMRRCQVNKTIDSP